MKSHRLKVEKFVVFSAFLSTTFVALYMHFFKHTPWEEVREILVHSELIALLPLGLILWYFEKFGWRHSLWSFLKSTLGFPPKLSGRWEGTLKRVKPEPFECGFVLEIEQTMTGLIVNTYSDGNDHSTSILDDVSTNQHESQFSLCYLWEGSAINLPTQKEDSGKFMGYTILDFREEVVANTNSKGNINNKILEGGYFTNRKPDQTQGTINVKWVSKKLKRKYQ